MDDPTLAERIPVWASRVPPGSHWFVVGSGPGLVGFDYDLLRGHWTIALNHAVERFRPTVHVFSDGKLGEVFAPFEYGRTAVATSVSAARNFTRKRTLPMPDTGTFRTAAKPELLRHGSTLLMNSTVACPGIQVAALLGAAVIFLLGVDLGWPVGEPYYGDGRDKKVSGRQSAERRESRQPDGRTWQSDHRHNRMRRDIGWTLDIVRVPVISFSPARLGPPGLRYAAPDPGFFRGERGLTIDEG